MGRDLLAYQTFKVNLGFTGLTNKVMYLTKYLIATELSYDMLEIHSGEQNDHVPAYTFRLSGTT